MNGLRVTWTLIASNTLNTARVKPRLDKKWCWNKVAVQRSTGQATKVISGDAIFCLPDTEYEELRLSVDIVVHCAWELSFSKAFDIFERIHIRGLSRLFELSQRCQYRPHIHFMSSLLALYAKETQSSSSNVQGPGQKPASPWPIGYTESKLIAEEMCRLASTKWGLPTTVYRIGQIAGSSSGNGVVWDRNQWLPSIMHSSKLIRKVPNSLGPAEVTWMPVVSRLPIIILIPDHTNTLSGPSSQSHLRNIPVKIIIRWCG